MPRAIAFVVVTLAGFAAQAAAWGEDAQAPPGSPPSVVQSIAPEDAEAILGRPVVDKTGKEIARLVDVLVDRNGTSQAAVIDFGGFLGVGARKIAVHWSVLHFAPEDGKHLITLDMTPDEIKSAPAFSNPDKPVSVVTPAPVANNSDLPTTAPAPSAVVPSALVPGAPAPASAQVPPAEEAPAGPESEKPDAAAQTR
jgi:PRC-barrel domain